MTVLADPTAPDAVRQDDAGSAVRQIRDALLVAIAGLALVVAGTLGFALASDPSPASDSADAGFARDMRDHHRQAVLMADIMRDRTTDPAIRYLAYDISNSQQAQAGMMSGWLQQWGLDQTDDDQQPMAWLAGTSGHGGHSAGHDAGGGATALLADGRMPGMASDADLARLRSSNGKDAEILWLRLMVDHHRGGVAMARAAVDLVEAPYERDLAAAIVDSQSAEIEYLNELLAARGEAPA